MQLPSNLQTGLVEARFVLEILDGPDPDREPEIIPAEGEVVLTASVEYWPAGAAEMVIIRTEKVAPLRDGFMCTPLADGSPGDVGVRLFATDDPDYGVTGWTWTATPWLKTADGTKLPDRVKPIEFSVPTNGKVDLSRILKAPNTPTVGIVQSEAAAAAAASAAASAAQSAASAQAAATNVVTRANSGEFKGDAGARGATGPQGAPGVAGAPGAPGATGPAGPAAALTIGTVTTGAAGANATATVSGTAPNQSLNLGLPRGAAGPQGVAGATGPAGAAGAKGDKGDAGPAGPQGVAGPQGTAGATGPQGERGLQGIQGATGAKGDKGDQGIPGAKGTDSSVVIADKPASALPSEYPVGVSIMSTITASNGWPETYGTVQTTNHSTTGRALQIFAARFTGKTWTRVANTEGWEPFAELRGAAGAAGAAGAKGDKGDKGDTGPAGPQGPAGAAGAAGATGPAGTASIATYPAGYVHARSKINGVWQDRGTTRADITVLWIGPEPSPAVVTTGTAGMYENDLRLVTVS